MRRNGRARQIREKVVSGSGRRRAGADGERGSERGELLRLALDRLRQHDRQGEIGLRDVRAAERGGDETGLAGMPGLVRVEIELVREHHGLSRKHGEQADCRQKLQLT